jgi:hypothetical protein
MFTSARKSQLSIALLAAFIMVLVTSACGFQRILPGRITEVVDISITEDMLQQGRPQFSINTPYFFMVNNQNFYDSLLDDVTRLELHDGYIRFIGTRNLPDGSVVPGSIDLYLGAQDDMLTARIIDLAIPGIALDDPLVKEINNKMDVEFSYAMISPDDTVLFKEVTIKEEELHMKIQVTIRF